MSSSLDARTSATVSVAWIVLANKPIYPLYVWWFLGKDAAIGSIATGASAPLYLAIVLFAARAPYFARLAMPLGGFIDTLVATKLFGASAGAELFFVPCATLALVGFSAAEYWTSRALTAVFFVAFAALHSRYGPAWLGWPDTDAAKIFDLNALAVASLTAFIGFRFSRIG
jgi:hypothetical protein